MYGSLHPDYVMVMADITHAAYYGIRRPADYGGTLASSHMESQVPRHDTDAYKLLVRTQRVQAVEAVDLRKRLSQIVDGESPPKEEA
jgi:transcription antitermination factor NusG